MVSPSLLSMNIFVIFCLSFDFQSQPITKQSFVIPIAIPTLTFDLNINSQREERENKIWMLLAVVVGGEREDKEEGNPTASLLPLCPAGSFNLRLQFWRRLGGRAVGPGISHRWGMSWAASSRKSSSRFRINDFSKRGKLKPVENNRDAHMEIALIYLHLPLFASV